MAKMTLVVLAAGMGTRFGTRIKQLEKLGPSGELLIDYSVHDAVKAGFDRVVFIIRHDIEELFKSTIGARVEKRIATEYVYQSPDQLPVRGGDFPSRTKPWGTAQALYCCRDVIDGPFAIVNADDFYGQDAFLQLGGFLSDFTADACSVGFLLKNTLSDFGTVNRGVCKTDAQGFLTSVEETKAIGRAADGVEPCDRQPLVRHNLRGGRGQRPRDPQELRQRRSLQFPAVGLIFHAALRNH